MASILAARTVGVLGSGSNEHRELAEEVGTLLARLGVNLLTGAGGGVMTAVSRAFIQSPRAGGVCIGIVPSSPDDPAVPKKGYPNPFVELPIFTHLPKSGEEGTSALSRNHINVLSSHALVALPGSAGTASHAAILHGVAAVDDLAADVPPADVPPPAGVPAVPARRVGAVLANRCALRGGLGGTRRDQGCNSQQTGQREQYGLGPEHVHDDNLLDKKRCVDGAAPET
jgi:uncharacterized protein (TIGR00725 family)